MYKNILLVLSGKKKEDIVVIEKAKSLSQAFGSSVGIAKVEENSEKMYERILDVSAKKDIEIIHGDVDKYNDEFNFNFVFYSNVIADSAVEGINNIISKREIDLILIAYEHGVLRSIFSKEDVVDKEFINNLKIDILVVPIV
ncbi:MAG: hypothetical protein R3Y52_00960 [Psittacicella sp.]